MFFSVKVSVGKKSSLVGHNVRIFWNISHFLAIITHLTETEHIKYMALGPKSTTNPLKNWAIDIWSGNGLS